MGCWNGSCALTGLPILHGDEVYAFLLFEQPRSMRHNHCHSNTYWSPLMYHFTGEYNDYGSIENCEGPMLDYIVKLIGQHVVEQEETPYNVAIRKDKFDINVLLKAERHDQLSIVSNWKREETDLAKQRVVLAMVHKPVIDDLLRLYKVDTYSHGTVGYDEILAVGHKLVEDLFSQEKIDTSMLDGISYDDMTEDQRKLFLKSFRRMNMEHITEYRLISDVKHHLRYPDLVYWDHDLQDVVDAGDHDMAESIVEQVALMTLLSMYMNDARRMWTPMSGAGSQEIDTNPHEVMANITLDMAKSINSRWDEEDEDD